MTQQDTFNDRNGQVSIRLATKLDIQSLVHLMQASYADANFPLDAAWAAAAFGALLENPALGNVWLGFQRKVSSEKDARPETLAGYVVLTVRFTMEYGGLGGVIDDLFVLPAHRRAGVGRMLLAALFAECRARGCKSVHVEVGQSNQPARELYAAFGLHAPTDDRIPLAGECS